MPGRVSRSVNKIEMILFAMESNERYRQAVMRRIKEH